MMEVTKYFLLKVDEITRFSKFSEWLAQCITKLILLVIDNYKEESK